MLKTVVLALLSFFISMGLGFLLLLIFAHTLLPSMFPGWSFILFIVYIPWVLIFSGICFSLPVFIILDKLLTMNSIMGRIIAAIIILLVVGGIFLFPKN